MTRHILVDIDELTTEGEMLGRSDEGRVLVSGTLPGERVEAELLSGPRRRSPLRAELRRVLVASPHRVTPICRHADLCGGCAWQHIAYPEQLRLKTDMLQRLLRDSLGRHTPRVLPMRPSPGPPGEAPRGYRNKNHFVFADDRGRLVMGHYRKGSTRVLPVDECPVHAPDANRLAFAVRDALIEGRVPPVNADLSRGVVRHIIVRAAHGTDERMVTLVVRTLDKRAPAAASTALASVAPQASLHLNLHDEVSSYLLGPSTKTMVGRDRLREQVHDVSYLVSPAAFFQTNVAAASVMVELALGAIPRDQHHVLDLYAGAGLFALPLARRGHKVVAVEENASAVADGVAARRLNGLSEAQCRFLTGRTEDVITSPRHRLAADVVVLDPPRLGCEPRVLSQVFERLRPRHVVYVSCHPPALANDLAFAAQAGYVARRVQPLDMFPHTTHIETVVHLTPDRA